MYGLPASGILAQQLLKKRLNKEGYSQSKLTPGFWTHKWRPVSFTLCIDDFGVKYVGIEHANHLISLLQESFKISTNWEGKRYLGLDLNWDLVVIIVKNIVWLIIPFRLMQTHWNLCP